MFGGPRHGPRPLDVDLLLLGDLELRDRAPDAPAPRGDARAASSSCRCSSSTRSWRCPTAPGSPTRSRRSASGAAGGAGRAALSLRRATARRRGRPQRLEPGGGQDRRDVARVVGDDAHRQLAGRPGLDRRRAGRRSVISSRRLVAIWKSAAFSCSPPSTPSAIQSSIRCEHPGQRGEVGADVLVGRLVEARRQGDDRRRGLHREPDRDPEPGALGVAARAASGRAGARSRASAGPPAAGPRRPSARPARPRPGRRVGGEERRLRARAGRARGRSRASPGPCARRSSAPAP